MKFIETEHPRVTDSKFTEKNQSSADDVLQPESKSDEVTMVLRYQSQWFGSPDTSEEGLMRFIDHRKPGWRAPREAELRAAEEFQANSDHDAETLAEVNAEWRKTGTTNLFAPQWYFEDREAVAAEAAREEAREKAEEAACEARTHDASEWAEEQLGVYRSVLGKQSSIGLVSVSGPVVTYSYRSCRGGSEASDDLFEVDARDREAGRFGEIDEAICASIMRTAANKTYRPS